MNAQQIFARNGILLPVLLKLLMCSKINPHTFYVLHSSNWCVQNVELLIFICKVVAYAYTNNERYSFFCIIRFLCYANVVLSRCFVGDDGRRELGKPTREFVLSGQLLLVDMAESNAHNVKFRHPRQLLRLSREPLPPIVLPTTTSTARIRGPG